ncbi:TetR/AcrR family transcriptional regulator [Luteipulveratus halotolerans]|uniref:TetR family transcriptional regulator n=1 Tax=Luteipulveratus halotolerans TaxID=1631356 RepID=A0A0L6CLR3_9MICO|nr:TetR/AcrR family transcriptional regulator [Luteipulveratus halotolerans]KNX38674.1 TetR family transcriptional regulator [Luteipulveratus halotolerans]
MTDTQQTRAPRADAQRSIAAILSAAEICLTRNAEASVAEIAREAGVGRVTVYGHFPSRADLVGAVFAQVLADADEALATVDLDGEPLDALRRLIGASWQVVHRFQAVLAAAERELSGEQVREHHERHLARLTEVLDRGRSAGVVRDDLPTTWLVTVGMTLMHAAAAEVAAGRLSADDAERAVVATVLSALGSTAA